MHSLDQLHWLPLMQATTLFVATIWAARAHRRSRIAKQIAGLIHGATLPASLAANAVGQGNASELS